MSNSVFKELRLISEGNDLLYGELKRAYKTNKALVIMLLKDPHRKELLDQYLIHIHSSDTDEEV